MKFNRLFFLSNITVLTMAAGCSDDFMSDSNDSWDDGSIHFEIYESGISTRSGTAGNSVQGYLGSQLTIENGDSLWFHFSETPNTSFFGQGDDTRALPITLNDLKDFRLSARVCSNKASTTEKSGFFFLDEPCENRGGAWGPSSKTYYWPQSEALSFYGYADGNCNLTSSSTDASPVVNITDDMMNGGKINFSYTVPKDPEGRNDADFQKDFIMTTATLDRNDATAGNAKLKFWHPLSGIVFKAGDLGNLTPQKIEIHNIYSSGSCTFDAKNEGKFDNCHWIENTGSKTDYTQSNLETKSITLNGKTIENCLGSPFLLLPHTDIPEDAEVSVTFTNGSVRRARLNVSGSMQLNPGNIYVISLSKIDENYPPVRNLQGMAGNNTVTLNWIEPGLNSDDYPYIHQIGVSILVKQLKGENQTSEKAYTYHKLYDPAVGDYPNPLDPDFLMKEIAEDINTIDNDRFVCEVVADYYNEQDPSEIKHSTGVTVEMGRKNTNTIVGFYMPNNGVLLDDDDIAAHDWLKNTYGKNFREVNKDNILDEQIKGMQVVWFPCGVSLRPRNNEGETIKKADTDDARYWMNWVNDEIFAKIETIPMFANSSNYDDMVNNHDLYRNQYRGQDYQKDNLSYEQVFQQKISQFSGLYNDPVTGKIMYVDPDTYFTENDELALAKFYRNGGNLLLTTYSMVRLYEMHIIPDNNYQDRSSSFEDETDIYKFPFTPHYQDGKNTGWAHRPDGIYFNEIKPTSIWFIRGNFDGHDSDNHDIYKGLFKCKGDFFKEYAFDGDPNSKHEDTFWVGTKNDIAMYPLLSMDALTCENNNVIWWGRNIDDKWSIDKLEADCNARFIATWGQIANTDVGVAVEFYPGPTHRDVNGNPVRGNTRNEVDVNLTHGRCICIGLGAYEFNNGTVYDTNAQVLNKYQSNVQQLTFNAIEYLKKANPDVRAPGSDPVKGTQSWNKLHAQRRRR